ncbi:halo transducer protein [Halorubrum ezzemoulense]|uniref:Halo transducer protein n=1 Tax=Halorubrum ezzemoulense TaxID=337243 RepID=A0A256IRF1_HALEZ|nr:MULTISPECIES: halo transducer protein [Halorubrum]OYR58866.1 halo transducer protein [Halorubrum ezzemoulense]OYR77571.1 halo transducer protein [Halorubrum ezzemoulense]OYR79187.1 halo transducer protein [Halorubrum ezzemoulense]PHQ41295.1 halo transducer protein [Halorubrum sp. C191]QAY20441.1 halo transducer protein [Halorubrum ezzemoulense]
MSESAPAETPLDELVESVADRTGEEPESIRTWLEPFTDDGRVTSAAIESSVTDVSQILATAETRVDLATRTHDEATAAADDAPDLEVVTVRRRAFGDRLDDLRAEVEALGDDLGAARSGLAEPVAVYRAAVALHEITTEAQDIVRVAHDLETELEAFEAWLRSANRRHGALVDEIDAAEESVAAVAETVASLRESDDPDPERRFEATLQTRVLELVVADLRAEAADLRAWADRDGVSFPGDVDARLDDLEAAVADHADALADGPDWDDRFDERLDTLDAELDAVEPPVAWARVDETVAAARSALSDDGAPADEPVSPGRK